jgi:hypothetical protein
VRENPSSLKQSNMDASVYNTTVGGRMEKEVKINVWGTNDIPKLKRKYPPIRKQEPTFFIRPKTPMVRLPRRQEKREERRAEEREEYRIPSCLQAAIFTTY